MAEKSRVNEVAVRAELLLELPAVVDEPDELAEVELDPAEAEVGGALLVAWLLLLQAPATRPAPMASAAKARLLFTGS